MVFEMDSFTLNANRKVIVEKDVFNGDVDNCDYEIENAKMPIPLRQLKSRHMGLGTWNSSKDEIASEVICINNLSKMGLPVWPQMLSNEAE